MEKNNNGKNIALVALVIAIVGLSIGFASLQAQLTITGSASVTSSSWSVNFKELVTPTVENGGLVGTPVITSAPTLTNGQLKEFNIAFNAPNQSVTYVFTIENAGSINAKIGTLNPASPTFTDTNGSTSSESATIVQNNFTYKFVYAETKTLGDGIVTYTEGQDVALNDKLPSGSSIKVKLVVGLGSIAAEDLPEENVTVSGLGITAIYVQEQ